MAAKSSHQSAPGCDVLPSTQAEYSCTSDSHCEFEGCNDIPCSSSSSYCVCRGHYPRQVPVDCRIISLHQLRNRS